MIIRFFEFLATGFRKQIMKGIFFGLISGLFALIQLQVPDYAQGITNLGEIPLLIAIFYFRRPYYLLLSVITAFLVAVPFDGFFILGVLGHFAGLLAIWFFYHYFMVKKASTVLLNIFYALIAVAGYYLIFLIPVITFKNHEAGLWIFEKYPQLINAFGFEMLATSLIFMLYLLQYNSIKKKNDHIVDVENEVILRTSQLDKTIEELNATNEKLQSVNNHLDSLVVQRTKQLENKNVQLSGYAFVNAHLLRAPLARILGLSYIIQMQLKNEQDKELMEKFTASCHEFDEVVKLLSKYLSEDSVMGEEQLQDLQDKIKKISVELASKV